MKLLKIRKKKQTALQEDGRKHQAAVTEEKRMADKPMKRGCLIIREMQIENMTQHFTPTMSENAPNFPFSIANPLGEVLTDVSSLEKNLSFSNKVEMQVF